MVKLCWIFFISIHTLRVEGDWNRFGLFSRCAPFQSTPSAWRVTVYVDARDISSNISIHTLRMEGD